MSYFKALDKIIADLILTGFETLDFNQGGLGDIGARDDLQKAFAENVSKPIFGEIRLSLLRQVVDMSSFTQRPTSMFEKADLIHRIKVAEVIYKDVIEILDLQRRGKSKPFSSQLMRENCVNQLQSNLKIKMAWLQQTRKIIEVKSEDLKTDFQYSIAALSKKIKDASAQAVAPMNGGDDFCTDLNGFPSMLP